MEPQVALDHAAAGGHRRLEEDVAVARQLHRGRGRAGGDVRQDDEHPRHCDARVVRAWPPTSTRPRCKRSSPDSPTASSIPGRPSAGSARAVTALYWGEEAASKAEAGFDQVFKERGNTRRNRGVPPARRRPGADVRPDSGCARDLGLRGAADCCRQGAVRVDGEVLEDEEVARDSLAGRVLQVGKRRFVRLVLMNLTR